VHALVTGAAGFVGSHLTEALLARGDTVTGVDCFTPYYAEADKRANLAGLEGPGFELVEVDLRSAPLTELVAAADVVFHEAAQPGVRLSWSDGFPDYLSHNVLATQRLLEAMVTVGGRCRLVDASSSSVYGEATRYPTFEDDLPRPHSPYGVTKLAAEHLCALYSKNWGIDTVVLRYFTVYGPRQRPDMSIHRLCEAALGGTTFPRFGDGRQVREFTYVSDIVAGNLLAAAADVPPATTTNLAGGAEITLADLITLVGELAGREVRVDPQPARPGDAFRNGGSTERAGRLFGWEPAVGLREGIAAQLAWHRARRGS